MSRGPSRWAIAFVGSRLLLRVAEGRVRLPTEQELARELGDEVLEGARVPAEVGPGRGRAVGTFGFTEELPAPEGYRLEGLRVAYHSLSTEEFRAAGAARQKVHWHRTSRFCSSCGASTAKHPEHEAMQCTACGGLHFPRVTPAVIVRVQRDREILLARSPRFPAGMYSVLAGFVEPGESLEECAHREIHEEVGVRVERLRYFGSQPHPFPHSLMVGFVADWREGEIRIDGLEIEDAGWFAPDRLPELPHPMSIARRLIDDFLSRATR